MRGEKIMCEACKYYKPLRGALHKGMGICAVEKKVTTSVFTRHDSSCEKGVKK